MNNPKHFPVKTQPLRWRFIYDIQTNVPAHIHRDDSTKAFQRSFNIDFPVITCFVHAPTEQEALHKGYIRVILYMTQKKGAAND